MTSRARRIVLAMYGHRDYTPAVAAPMHTLCGVPVRDIYGPGWHGCYEAMDEPDPREILVGGNYGLPCA